MNAINRTDAVSVIIRGVEYSKEKYRFEIIDGDLFIIEKQGFQYGSVNRIVV